MDTLLNEIDISAMSRLLQNIQECPEKGDTKWKAEVNWKQGFQSEAKIGSHVLQSDVQSCLGGKGAAPNPVEQLIAALGNCLVIGYVASATVANIKLKKLRVDLEGDLNLRTFLGLNKGGNAGYSAIRILVNIESDVSKEILQELHKHVLETSPVGHSVGRAVALNVQLQTS